MQKAEFLTIFATYDALSTIQTTLPSVIEETKRAGAALIVHDSTDGNRNEVWAWLQEQNKNNDFFLILSSNMSMAHARNMCLALGVELYAPDYICMMEDDHGFKPGLIPEMIAAMKQYYGKPSPNGLRYGLFTACRTWPDEKYHETLDGHAYPDGNSPPLILGGANSCFRCAPASHWHAILKGYDPDEYLISGFQTAGCNQRNYNNGFTTLVVRNGNLISRVKRTGRGVTRDVSERIYDHHYTATDRRSRYWGKPADSPSGPAAVDAAAIVHPPRSASISGFSTLERAPDGECWRWALGPESNMVVDVSGECDAILDFEFVNPIAGQVVEIECNGSKLREITPAQGECVTETMQVTLQPGSNWIVFRYGDWNAHRTLISNHDARPLAVRFTRLNVISAGEPG